MCRLGKLSVCRLVRASVGCLVGASGGCLVRVGGAVCCVLVLTTPCKSQFVVHRGDFPCSNITFTGSTLP